VRCRTLFEVVLGVPFAAELKLTLEEFRSLAARQGGGCLSDRYTNKEAPLRWQCALGHRWYAQPGRVKRGTWCAKCANPRRRSCWKADRRGRDNSAFVIIHDMQKFEVASRAKQRGVRSVPAVVIDGELAGCRTGRDPMNTCCVPLWPRTDRIAELVRALTFQ
jgi:hypothetical protein